MVRLTCLRVVAVGLVLVGGLVVGVTPASAELGDNNNLRWGVDGTDLPPGGQEIRTEIWAMEQIGDRVYVGGRFQRVTNGTTTVDQKYLAAFDAGTGEYIASFNSTLDAVVYLSLIHI